MFQLISILHMHSALMKEKESERKRQRETEQKEGKHYIVILKTSLVCFWNQYGFSPVSCFKRTDVQKMIPNQSWGNAEDTFVFSL